MVVVVVVVALLIVMLMMKVVMMLLQEMVRLLLEHGANALIPDHHVCAHTYTQGGKRGGKQGRSRLLNLPFRIPRWMFRAASACVLVGCVTHRRGGGGRCSRHRQDPDPSHQVLGGITTARTVFSLLPRQAAGEGTPRAVLNKYMMLTWVMDSHYLTAHA